MYIESSNPQSMQLINTTNEILNQLSDLCSQLTSEEYSRDLSLLLDNSIGKHIRHIIEFYDRLMLGMENGIVNYDHRKHSLVLETKVDVALEKLQELSQWVSGIQNNSVLEMQVSYAQEGEKLRLNTNVERELVYNIEHAIHHMAIIRIALQQEFVKVKVDKNFGIAYSTVKFRDDQCAR
jgi:uncharacterized damage-inducible protein DinB